MTAEEPLKVLARFDTAINAHDLNEMLALGQSKPWQEALATLTGEKQMDANALTDYFAPLKTWLDEQNKTKAYPIGW